MRRAVAVLLALFSFRADAQLKVLRVETLPVGHARVWSQPVWSPDAKTVYYTSADYNGIWAYSISGRTAVQITPDRGSGYGFTVSPDGGRIAWRRTLSGALPGERVQEAIVRNLADGSTSVLASGQSVTPPSFIGSGAVYSISGEVRGASAVVQPAGSVAILGIEETKIAVLRNGVKSYLDPLGGGSYIWPSLSPDGSRLVAYEMDRGTFVADPDGHHATRIGRRDAPSWTRDGKWIVYMADKDDGHAIRSSNLAYVSPDGKTSGMLTAAEARGGMYPRCSPVSDEIVCSTLKGEILVISYTGVPR